MKNEETKETQEKIKEDTANHSLATIQGQLHAVSQQWSNFVLEWSYLPLAWSDFLIESHYFQLDLRNDTIISGGISYEDC